MSNYRAPAWNPKSGKVEDADWIDDHFGAHVYGVRFADSSIYRTTDVGMWAVCAALSARDAEVEGLKATIKSKDWEIETGRAAYLALNNSSYDTIAALRAEVERLTKERDEADARLLAYVAASDDEKKKLRAQLASAKDSAIEECAKAVEHYPDVEFLETTAALLARKAASLRSLKSQGAGDGASVEIRCPDGPGIIDEIVGKNVKLLHVEQMHTSGWYMGLDMADGSHWQFWFGAKNRKSAVEFRHVETLPAPPADNTDKREGE